jgi:hypothetical protein
MPRLTYIKSLIIIYVPIIAQPTDAAFNRYIIYRIIRLCFLLCANFNISYSLFRNGIGVEEWQRGRESLCLLVLVWHDRQLPYVIVRRSGTGSFFGPIQPCVALSLTAEKCACPIGRRGQSHFRGEYGLFPRFKLFPRHENRDSPRERLPPYTHPLYSPSFFLD